MKLAVMILAGSMLLAGSPSVFSSQALAQQAGAGQADTGMVTAINRLDGMIAIAQIPSGTTGASGGAAVEQFKASGDLLDNVHAGDVVTYSTTGTSGTRTITKIDRKK